MENRWKEIWNRRKIIRSADELSGDEFQIYRELKRLDGFDVSVEEEEKYYSSFYRAAVKLFEDIKKQNNIESVYEVGCGSGADLYLLQNRRILIEGIDYSEQLTSFARQLLGEDKIHTGEAIEISTDKKFDMVLCDSVFAYFSEETYGEKVLEKMYDKANKVVVVLEVFDKELETECNEHRRSMIADYDEKYEGLNKIFYPQSMFVNFAKKHHCKVEFTSVENDFYWNSRYQYNCFIYKE